MCLAAGFFPKGRNMTLTVGDKTVSHAVDNAVLSTTSGKYYYAKYSTEDITNCEMNGEKANKQSPNANENRKEGNQIYCKPSNKGTNKTEEISNTDDFKRNSLSLLVTGLRLLLAKAVAVNVMMTIKAFLA
ncbi:T cell receptor delta constant [Pygocentrus nattereri]|uniref:T cell receptor delta constant n=1 Tax=Pygocentrus nattereri TaxID=42514 RepID=UPI001891A9BF|nr:T cell receptor delta constant [Pygocentrus nattereri]